MILVTGGSGQLANEFKKIIPENESLILNKLSCDIVDLPSLEEIFSRQKIKLIINCAAYTNVEKAEQEVDQAFLVNALGAKNVAIVAKKYNIPLVHISTDYVFDGSSNVPICETDKVNPLSVYGKSKLKGEEEILKIAPNGAIIRTSWLYSCDGKNFVTTISKVGLEKKHLKVIIDQVGSPTNAKDLAEFIMKIYPKITSKKIEIYNFSNEGVASWYDFAQAVIEYKKINCVVDPIKTKDYSSNVQRPAYSVLDKEKISKEFGVIPKNWRESLKSCIFHE